MVYKDDGERHWWKMGGSKVFGVMNLRLVNRLVNLRWVYIIIPSLNFWLHYVLVDGYKINEYDRKSCEFYKLNGFSKFTDNSVGGE